MENQGYEEEQSRGEESVTAFVTNATTAYTDGHFYEDISTLPEINPRSTNNDNDNNNDTEDLSKFFVVKPQDLTDTTNVVSEKNFNGNIRKFEDIVDCASRDETMRFVIEEEEEEGDEEDKNDVRALDMTSTFQRNLTLPFRRGSTLDLVTASSSVRVTNREKNAPQESIGTRILTDTLMDNRHVSVTLHGQNAYIDRSRGQNESIVRTHVNVDDCNRPPPARRRRKKDCKHCRNKATGIRERENVTEVREHEIVIAQRNRKNQEEKEKEKEKRKEEEEEEEEEDGTRETCRNGTETILAVRNFGITPVPHETGRADATTSVGTGGGNGGTTGPSTTVFLISENMRRSTPPSTNKYLEYERNDVQSKINDHGTKPSSPTAERRKEEDKAPIVSKKNRVGMRVNSIYSQERWYAKEAPIFFTDVNKEHNSFQRAYSLPVRTQTPSSQNRVNLRRSVRGEPPPHPARLHKHRHGWTLHLARPLEGPGCTRSFVFLLIVILALLGVGAIALYIVFEPEKLQIIQQYLRSSKVNSTTHGNLPEGTYIPTYLDSDDRNVTSTTTSTNNASIVSLSDVHSSFLPDDTVTLGITETETEGTGKDYVGNATRYCDDCFAGEVCVALVDEEVPICRIAVDNEDPTGCAGYCLINKQKCHRLDADALRCVEVEHYCLDDEWRCLNTLCIPLEKHCDGHMNCYDHSDEYNCVCDLETHFQCGNETSCLPLEKRCDGKIDCWDATDEINCTLACPLENEFTCSNGQCILKARFCDGLPDCDDGSDEPHGCQGRCNKHEFTCQNSRCITKGMKCNGIDDCGDGTDERHCKDRPS